MTRPLLISVRINLAFPEHLEATIYIISSADYTDSADFNEHAKAVAAPSEVSDFDVTESADNYRTVKTKAATGITRLRLSKLERASRPAPVISRPAPVI